MPLSHTFSFLLFKFPNLGKLFHYAGYLNLGNVIGRFWADLLRVKALHFAYDIIIYGSNCFLNLIIYKAPFVN